MPLPKEDIHTTADIYALPDGERAELIDGQIYDMAPPSRIHQKNCFGETEDSGQYSFKEEIPVSIYLGLKINITELLK